MDHPAHRHLDGLRAGARQFDAGRWWHAHEEWETVWRTYQGPDRHYLKGLIQFAAANFHLVRGRVHPARMLLDRAAQHLARHDPLRWPFDTGHLLIAAAALAASIDAGRRVRPATIRLEPMIDAWLSDHHAHRTDEVP